MDLGAIWLGIIGPAWSRFAFYLVAGAVVGLVVAGIVSAVFRSVARRRDWPDAGIRRMRWPFRLLLVVVGAWIGFNSALWFPTPSAGSWNRFFLIATILVSAWFASAILSFLVDIGLTRYRTDVADNRVARRVRTQILVIRRVGIAAIVVVALAAVLLSFPGAQAAGASLLASAGVVSIIAGLAAQSTLGNVIAGMQLAFSGAIRVDDVVIANGEWGRIEEITLTYVVVHVWDDRRMLLPSTYFTTTPFENWTRTSSELMQAVEFDLDWRVDPQAMRDEMHRVLAATTLWDRRVSVLQVTDAVGGMVHVRILVTAVDAPTLFDLRCFVREEMIGWLQAAHPEALPRTRVLLVDGEPPRSTPDAARRHDRDDRELFGGSAAAERRGREFTGPIAVPDLAA